MLAILLAKISWLAGFARERMMKFTDRAVLNLKPQADRHEIWEGTGLGVRVSVKGRKSWVMVYRFQGKPRYLTLGTYPEMSVAQAHEAHRKALATLEPR